MADEKTEEVSSEETLFDSEEKPEIKTEVETEEKSEEKTTEKSEETEKSEDKTEEKSETKEIKSVPIAAFHDKKRQVDQLKGRVQELEAQLPSTEAPDAFEDLEAHDAFVRDQAIKEMTQEQNRIRLENIEVSRNRMLEKHSDYAEMEKIFEIMTASDPELIQQMTRSGDEAQFAYTKAIEYKKSLLGETEKKEDSKTEQTDTTAVDTPSLATATAQASNLPQAEKEDTIDDVFADVKY